MEYALVLLICSSVAGNCLPPVSYDERFEDAYGCMVTGYQRSLETTKTILIGDFFEKENLIKFFKLLPEPEIKTAVFNLLEPRNFFI